jgi:hypothetical protein
MDTIIARSLYEGLNLFKWIFFLSNIVY